MSNAEQSKLWRNYDDNGKSLFTSIPNALMNGLISGHFGELEMKIILFISRMTYGFRREETNYLGPEDFKSAIGIQKSHFSTIIRNMLKNGLIFRGKKNGSLYKYAVNLLSYGRVMKCYKIVEEGYKLSDGEYALDAKSYVFSNSSNYDKGGIVYKPSGFDKSEESYIKKDRNLDTNKDIKLDSKSDDASASSLGAPCAEADNNKLSTATSPIGATCINDIASGASDKDQKLQTILNEFEQEVMQWSSVASQVMARYMEILKDAGFSTDLISLRFNKLYERRKSDINGELFNPDAVSLANQMYENERKRKGL